MDSTKNFAKVTVSTGYNNTDVTIVLTAGHGAKLPTAPFNVTWWNSTDYSDPSDDPNVEVVRVTAISTDTLTVTRAQEGTSGSTKNTGAKTYKMIAGLTSKMVNDIYNLVLPVTEVTSTSQSMGVNQSYIANNASLVTLTLPSSAAVGDIVRVVGKGAGGWKIAQNASGIIHCNNGDTTTGTGGYLSSLNQYDCITLECLVANNEWTPIDIRGSLFLN